MRVGAFGPKGYRVRLFKAAVCAVVLSSCAPLDTEQTIKAKAQEWVFVSEVFNILSEQDCTAAALRLEAAQLRFSGMVHVSDVRSSLPHLEIGRAVAFTVPGATPNQVSEQLMSMRLFEGLGMLGSFIGPGRRCMDSGLAIAANEMLHSPTAIIIYDPSDYVILLTEPGKQQAIFLHTKG